MFLQVFSDIPFSYLVNKINWVVILEISFGFPKLSVFVNKHY